MIDAVWFQRAWTRAFFATLRGVSRLLRAGNSDRAGCLIVPCAAPGSVGDEAMLSALVSACRISGLERVDLLARPNAYANLDVNDRRRPTGGWIAEQWGLWCILGEYRYVFVLGADCLDGAYSLWRSLFLVTVAHVANAAGAKVTIIGSSFNKRPDPAAVAAIRSLPASVRLCLRDRHSLDRAQAMTGRSGVPVADVAFLLQPVEAMPGLQSTLAWLRAQRGAGQILLGVNLNSKFFAHGDGARAEVPFEAFVSALRRAIDGRTELSILIIPHDYRGEANDLDYGERLLATIAPSARERVALLAGRRTAAEVKGVVGRLDAVLTGRMHLAIAALGCGVPVACVTYQDKFEGLLEEHFDLPEMLLSPDEACDATAIFELVEVLLQERRKLGQQIACRLPAVRALSWTNLPEELREPSTETRAAVPGSFPGAEALRATQVSIA